MFKEDIEVKAEIAALPGISGHADKRGLIAWLKGFEKKPELVFVNHGDPESADGFTACLNDELGYKAFAPYSGTVFDLAKGEFERITDPKPIERKASAPRRTNPLFNELVSAAEALLAAVRKCDGRPNRELRGFIDSIKNLTGRIK